MKEKFPFKVKVDLAIAQRVRGLIDRKYNKRDPSVRLAVAESGLSRWSDKDARNKKKRRERRM